MALAPETIEEWRSRWVHRVLAMTKAEIQRHETAIGKHAQKLDDAATAKKQASLRSKIADRKRIIKEIREWYGEQQRSAKDRWGLEIPDLP